MRRSFIICVVLLATAVGAAGAEPAPPVGASAGAQESPDRVAVDAPGFVLGGVPLELTLTLAGSAEATPYRIVNAAGRELGSGTLLPGTEVVVEDLGVSRSDLPLRIEIAGDATAPAQSIEVAPRYFPGWVSVLPPLLAIALALIFHEVVVSLFLGVWLGALIVAGLNPLTATLRAIDSFILPALYDPDHVAIIIFSMLLGGMVGVVSRSGGTRGIVEAVSPLATTPRRAQLATYLSGLAIFFDDYANTLIVGNTMRPITDRLKVSREKLAYIVDSTAAPVAAIVFVSTWVGFEISLIGDGLRIAAGQSSTAPDTAAVLLSASPFSVFIRSIPYLFYPILALLMVGLIIFTQRDFGPMHAAESRASRGEGLYRDGAMLMVDAEGSEMEPPDDAPRRWFNAALPVLTVIVVVLLGLYLDGKGALGPEGGSLLDIFGAANAFNALLWGSLFGCLVAIGLAVGQRILSVQAAIRGWIAGIRAMMLAFVILGLAWSLGEVTEVLGTAQYLTGLISDALPVALLPAIVFITAAVVAFATGTSWATMAILVPLVIPLAVALGGMDLSTNLYHPHLLATVAAVLAGAIWGDHCSPISDTTVLSSMASACDHVDHVRTQLPYAVVVALVALLAGNLLVALGIPAIVSYVLGGLALFLVLRFIGRLDYESPQWSD